MQCSVSCLFHACWLRKEGREEKGGGGEGEDEMLRAETSLSIWLRMHRHDDDYHEPESERVRDALVRAWLAAGKWAFHLPFISCAACAQGRTLGNEKAKGLPTGGLRCQPFFFLVF
jgi:hypothetical protein